MVKLYDGGAYLVNGTELIPEKEGLKVTALTGKTVSKEEAKKAPLPTLFQRLIILQGI